jgi:hypothetical protein
MFLHAYTYEQNEPVFINMNEIFCIYSESRFAELSVHMKDSTVIVIRGTPGWAYDALSAKSVFKKVDCKELHDYGIQMQKNAVDPQNFSLEERLQAVEKVVEDFDLENYPLSDFDANLKMIRDDFKEFIEEKFNVQQANS